MNCSIPEEWTPYIRGGVFGFAVGVAFIVPAFVWLTGKLEGHSSIWYKIFSK
jgi:hypothetical protein